MVEQFPALLLHQCDLGGHSRHLTGAYQYLVSRLETYGIRLGDLALWINESYGLLERPDLLVGDHGVWSAGIAARTVAPCQIADASEDRRLSLIHI